MSATQVKVEMTFDADDLQAMLTAASFGNESAVQLADMTGKEFRAFTAELQFSGEMFKEEIIETIDDACANDFLCEWYREDE